MEQVFANARIVTADEVFTGSVAISGDRIVAMDRGAAVPAGAMDLGGEWLLPGFVELHTDNLEKHVGPRPGVRWPMLSAILAHDAQIAAAGITTVFDAVAIGVSEKDKDFLRRDMLQEAVNTLLRIEKDGLGKTEHFLHLRCEVANEGVPDMVAPLLENPLARLVSLMDHTVGQRQFVDEAKFREYYQGRFGFNDAQMDAMIERGKQDAALYSDVNRRDIVAMCVARGVPMASHDDATLEHVEESLSLGLTIAEFPTTVVAAQAARDGGMRTIMGAPNVVRGGSHSGNISAAELARRGLLDCLSSDYVPASLGHAAFMLHDTEGVNLPDAVAKISINPARMIGLDDRGEIAIGKRADLVRIALADRIPVIRQVWRAGERVI